VACNRVGDHIARDTGMAFEPPESDTKETRAALQEGSNNGNGVGIGGRGRSGGKGLQRILAVGKNHYARKTAG